MGCGTDNPLRREYRDKMPLESEHAPGGIILHYADGDEEIIHVNQYVVDLFECESIDEFFELTHGTFKGFVYTDDIDASEESIWSQVDTHDNYGHIYYRIKTKSGKLVNVDGYGRLVEEHDGPGSRPVFHAFVIKVEQGGSVDWLTGLPDMARFFQLAQLGVDAMFERGERPAILALDLIGMKAYNMKYGRDAGDRLLQAFAEACAGISAGRRARASRRTTSTPSPRARCSGNGWMASSMISGSARTCPRFPYAPGRTCWNRTTASWQ